MKADIVAALLGLGCLSEVICVGGVLWFRDGFDELHFSSAASTVGLFCVLAALIIQGFSSVSGTIDCAVALVLTFILNPVMTSATARAGRRMRFESLEPRPSEYRHQP